MLNRLLWIGLAILALVGGLLFQNRILFGVHDGVRGKTIEARVAELSDSKIADRMTVVSADGRPIEIPRETKQAMAAAIHSYISARAELALLRARNAQPQDIQAAQQRSDTAHAQIERVKAQIDEQRQLSERDRDALRSHIQNEVRQAVRDTVRG
jgi:electron transfer flavoprotein alpha subunit